MSKLLVIGVLFFGYGITTMAEPNRADAATPSVLTEAQSQWLAQRPNLRIGLTYIPPQVFRDEETGELTGLCIDYIHAVESRLGYTFQLEHFKTWDEMMAAASECRIDAIYAAQQTPSRLERYLFTQPYLNFENMIVTSQDVYEEASLKSLAGKKVTVVRGAAIEEELANKYPSIKLVPVEDELRGLLLVSFKEADAMVIEPARASYLINEKKITNLHVAGGTDIYYQLGFAVRKELPELRNILDAGLAAIPLAERKAILNKWVYLPHVDLQWLWWMLGTFGTIIIAAIGWNVLLRRQVERRTTQLQDELHRRTEAEESRQQMEEGFRHVIEFCPIGVLIYRLESGDRLVLTAANTAAEKILSIDLRPQIGKTIEEVFPALAKTDIPDRYRAICKNGIPSELHGFHYEDERIHGNYEIRAFQTTAGQLTVMFTDITEQIQAREALEHSEKQFRGIFNASPVGIGIVSNRRFVKVNEPLCKITGYTAEELVGQNTRMFYFSEDEYERIGQDWYSQLQDGRINSIQTLIRRKDGTAANILLHAAVFNLSKDSNELIFAVADITNQIAAQKALIESESQLSSIFRAVAVGFAIVADRKFVRVNDRFCTMFDYTEKELIGQPTHIIYSSEEDYETFGKDFYVRLCAEGSVILQHQFRKKNGILLDVMISAAVMDEKDPSKGAICSLIDITDQIAAQKAMECSEARFRGIFRASPVGIGTVIDRRFVSVNEQLCKMLGYSAEDLIGQSARIAYFSDEEYKRVGKDWYEKLQENRVGTIQTVHRRKDGTPLDVLLYASALGSGEVICSVVDITEHLAAQKALERSEAQFRAIFRASPIGISTICNRRFVSVNEQFCQIVGYSPEELIGQSTRLIYFTDQEYERIGREWYPKLLKKGIETIQTVHRRKDGTQVDILLHASVLKTTEGAVEVVCSTEDITEHLASQKALAQSQQRLATLMGNLPGIAYRCKNTPDWPMEFISKGCKDLTGYEESDFYNDPTLWQCLILPDDRQMVWGHIQEALAEHKNFQLEYRIHTADGQEKWVWEQGCNVTLDADKETMIEGLIIDITARKQIKKTLQFFQFAVERSGEAAYWLDFDGRFVYANDGACRSFGCSREELMQMTIQDVNPTFTAEKVKPFWDNLRKNKTARFETRHKRKNGTLFPVEITSNYIVFDGKEYNCVFALDISKRKQAEELLRLNAERTAALLKINQMADAPMNEITDFALEEAVRLTNSKVGYIAFLNDEQTILTIHSWSRQALADCMMTDKPQQYNITNTGLWGEVVRQRKPIITNNYAADNSLKRGTPEGHIPIIRHMNVPIIVRGKIVLVAGVGNKEQNYDQTDVEQLTLLMEGMWNLVERIHAKQAREKLMRELQAKNEELEGIVFIASHDLRSPLINIQGFAGELQKSCRELIVLLGRESLSDNGRRAVRAILDEDIPESLNFISAGTSKMDTLVKGLLRLARIGTTQMHIEVVDMNRLMSTILKTVQYQMREHEIEINLSELPACFGDWVQLNQVFSNLIDNAIKYRYPGRKAIIDISAASQDGRVRYAVRDNGIGIAPEHNRRIFEIFHRLNPAGPIKGEGLGLSIVQRILDRLDGKISVESAVNEGATFVVDMPVASEK